jgi:hypothetical protein
MPRLNDWTDWKASPSYSSSPATHACLVNEGIVASSLATDGLPGTSARCGDINDLA